MLIIFPTGHDETHARRFPWITTVLLVGNLLLFIVFGVLGAAKERAAELPLREAIDYLNERPYLSPPPLLDALLSDRDRKTLALARENVARVPVGEQEELDRLSLEAHQALRRLPSFRLGYRPADANLLGLITHQFMHGGWFHLLGNLWFLWLCGYILEDAWGRLAFPGFYLVAGAVAGVAHHAANPASVVPLIGASGAIAGVMGAFLVRNASTRIRFFAWVLVRPLRFSAPAYVMLPLWFGAQLVWGTMEPDGVAYWAHVGGFVFGVLGALLLQGAGFERLVQSRIEEQGVVREDPEIARLAGLTDVGRAPEAVERLRALLARSPRRVDAWLELLRASAAAGDQRVELEAKAKLIELYLHDGAGEAAHELYRELSELQRSMFVPAAVRLRLGRHYERTAQSSLAWTTYQQLHGAENVSDLQVAAAALLAHAELALKLGRKEEAIELWQRAEAAGDPAVAGLVKQGLARAHAMLR